MPDLAGLRPKPSGSGERARLSSRQRTLEKLRRVSHRFSSIRRLTMGMTLVVLYAIPLGGVARVDLWRGEHMWLLEPAHWVVGLGAVIGGIGGLYVVTFLLNWGGGRLFCGFGCPVGQLSRFADEVETSQRGKKRPTKAWSQAILFAFALVGGMLAWWVDPRVLVDGEPLAVAATAGAWLVGTALALGHGHFWRWVFCKKWCPIGLYYSAIQLSHNFGVHFDETACNHCNLCAMACPVNLDPTNLVERIDGSGGLAFDGFPGRNHCLSCGDCVQACELVSKHPSRHAALELGFGSGKVVKR